MDSTEQRFCTRIHVEVTAMLPILQRLGDILVIFSF